MLMLLRELNDYSCREDLNKDMLIMTHGGAYSTCRYTYVRSLEMAEKCFQDI